MQAPLNQIVQKCQLTCTEPAQSGKKERTSCKPDWKQMLLRATQSILSAREQANWQCI